MMSGPIRGKVLVTGADGFIGSHLVEELLSRGVEVRALVWYNARGSWGWLEQLPRSALRGLEVVAGDIRDPHAMKATVQGCEAVLNLAALIGIPYSYGAPHSYVDTNIGGTLNLLVAAAEAGVRRFVQTSTSEVYGTAQSVPITEEHPLQAQSPYAASKCGADQMALAFGRSSGLPVTVLRPFNTYGPRQSARAIIPTIITQLLPQGTRATLKMGALDPTRDLTFVSDTVRGFVAATTAEGAVGEVIQLGTDHEISMGELAALIAELAGKQLVIEADPARIRPTASEVMRLRASHAKAKRILGWEPLLAEREGLREGLARTLRWFSDGGNLGLYRPDSYQV